MTFISSLTWRTQSNLQTVPVFRIELSRQNTIRVSRQTFTLLEKFHLECITVQVTSTTSNIEGNTLQTTNVPYSLFFVPNIGRVNVYIKSYYRQISLIVQFVLRTNFRIHPNHRNVCHQLKTLNWSLH